LEHCKELSPVYRAMSPRLDAPDFTSVGAPYRTGVSRRVDAAFVARLKDCAGGGMTEIAKSAGICIRRCGPGSAPRLDTVSRLCAALGLQWVVVV
jgi:DNA-binding phage protein